jgi:hypothetical protein
MDRNEIVCVLDAVVVERLFGDRPWLADDETMAALNQMLLRLGLEEQVPGRPDHWQYTPLGRELRLELLCVFMGWWHEWDAVIILEKYGLIEEADCEFLFSLETQEEFERELKTRVQEAYFEYFNSSRLMS